MRFNMPLFTFESAGRVFAAIQAPSKEVARLRADFVSHLVKIPENCKVRGVRPGTWLRCPVFYEGHFLGIEEAMAELRQV